MSRPYREWSTEDLNFIKENVSSMTYLAIANHFGVSYSKVQGFIARTGLSRKRKKVAITYPTQRMVKELANKGFHYPSLVRMVEYIRELNSPPQFLTLPPHLKKIAP